MSNDFQKWCQTIQCGKNNCSTDNAGMTWYPHAKNEVGPYLTSYTKVKNECDLIEKIKTIKLLEDHLLRVNLRSKPSLLLIRQLVA